MDILRQSMAPISEEAWEEINTQATKSLTSHLSARRFVDVKGPMGWDFGAIHLGRIEILEGEEVDGVRSGLHKVQPLLESRIRFALNIWELDNAARGAQDVDLAAMEEAAVKMALFEERAIYYGFERASITGLKAASEYEPMKYPDNIEEILGTVSEGVNRFHRASIEGPYTLILNPKRWGQLASFVRGYPLKPQLQELIGGQILVSDVVDDVFLVSQRGEDFVMTLGQDFSIGFEKADSQNVQLFFTESFTFQVFEPAAVLVFE